MSRTRVVVTGMGTTNPVGGDVPSTWEGLLDGTKTLEEMATRYVDELRAAHRGPYLLGGYSGGGTVTFEMIRQLQALGEEVRFLVLFDSVPPGKAEPRRGWRWRTRSRANISCRWTAARGGSRRAWRCSSSFASDRPALPRSWRSRRRRDRPDASA